jgi:hypothetical protein
MKKALITLLVVVAVLALVWFYLVSSTPTKSAGVAFPLSASQRALLAQVPATADAFVLVPGAGAVEAKLQANPVAADLLAKASQRQQWPRPWMLGGADIVAWTAGKQTTYLVHLDPFRAAIARAWLLANGDERFLINAGSPEPIVRADLDQILNLTNGMAPGDALLVQRSSGRGAFPPIPRPAVSTVVVEPAQIVITSRAAADPGQAVSAQPLPVKFPKTAILSATFAQPPRALDLARVMRKQTSTLLQDGGTLAIYDIDTGTLLPKPKEVIAVPATDPRRAALGQIVGAIGKTGQELTGLQTTDANGELVVSFDAKSRDHYLKDGFDPAPWPANVWAARIDTARMIPLLNEMDGNAALRIVAPRLYRSIRDLRHWIGSLDKASAIEAAESNVGGIDELKVRILGK